VSKSEAEVGKCDQLMRFQW